MAWTAAEEAVWATLDSPRKLQDHLDATPYSTDPFYRSPRSVLRDRRAHCVDGALFAACGLRRLGLGARIAGFWATRDDDHLVALYRIDGCWGAVSKSNTVGLRFREPIYRTIRELALSYFEVYFNLEAEKSMRRYTKPLPLAPYDRYAWETDDARIEETFVAALDHVPTRELLTPAQIARLSLVDRKAFDGNLLGADPDGLWKN